MYKISVIIPVYNEEKYIEESLKSVERQTMDFNDIEVIIVSDGSTDRTDEIAKKFIENKNNCKFIRLEQPSGSAGKPRNIGIENATGEYLMFLDADDFFEKDAFEKMYKAIEKSGYEFVTANYKLVNSDGKEIDEYGFDINMEPRELTLDNFSDKKIYCNGAVWNKIFRTEFVKKINCKCLEGVFAEDLYFTINCFLETKKVLFLPNIICVNYRIMEKSASRDITYKYFDKINSGYKSIYDKCKLYNQELVAKIFFVEAKNFFIQELRFSKVINNEQFLKILEKMEWYFKLLKDFEV